MSDYQLVLGLVDAIQSTTNHIQRLAHDLAGLDPSRTRELLRNLAAAGHIQSRQRQWSSKSAFVIGPDPENCYRLIGSLAADRLLLNQDVGPIRWLGLIRLVDGVADNRIPAILDRRIPIISWQEYLDQVCSTCVPPDPESMTQYSRPLTVDYERWDYRVPGDYHEKWIPGDGQPGIYHRRENNPEDDRPRWIWRNQGVDRMIERDAAYLVLFHSAENQGHRVSISFQRDHRILWCRWLPGPLYRSMIQLGVKRVVTTATNLPKQVGYELPALQIAAILDTIRQALKVQIAEY